MLPLFSLGAAVVVGSLFAAAPVPMAGKTSHLGDRSWRAVAPALVGAGVHTIYVDIESVEAMPDAAAIADQAVRHGLRVEVDQEALHFLDPSFALTVALQFKVVVCCGKHDPGLVLTGMDWRGRVGGQQIYTGRYVLSTGERRQAKNGRSCRQFAPGG